MGRGSQAPAPGTALAAVPTSRRGRVRQPARDTKLQLVGSLDDHNLHMHVNVDYNMDYSCEESGCEEEGICRCGVMTDAHVDYFSPHDLRDQWEMRGGDMDTMTAYGIERIISRAHLAIDDFTVETTGGYYGDEVGSVGLEPTKARAIDQAVGDYFVKRRLNEQVEWLLKHEYGRLLPQLKGAEYRLEIIDRQDLVFGAQHHQKNLRQDALKRYRDEQARPLFRNDPGLPLGVVQADGKHYRVIDGYHRLSASLDGKAAHILVIVADPNVPKPTQHVPRMVASRQQPAA